MKKLAIIALVALVAGLSQAAFVKWNSGTIKAPKPDGTFGANLANSSLFTATVSFFSDAGGTTPVTGVTGNTGTTTSALGQFSATTGGTVFTAGATYYARIFITSNPGAYPNTTYTMTSTLASFTEPGTGNGSVNFGTYLPSQWTVTTVPEPLSMALFGIGAAVIGLRRKFRK